MFIFLFLSLLSAPTSIEEIKVGDCLTFEDMQKVVGVYSKDVYLAGDGKCGVDYPTSDSVYQGNLCADPIATGTWQRKLAEAKKFGIFFPWSPPCYAFVTEADFVNYALTPLASEDEQAGVCNQDNMYVSHIQTETFRTKKWEVGEGYMYLPEPLIVRDEKYLLDQENQYSQLSCIDRHLTVTYKGWGSFESHWKEFSCGSEISSVCRVAKMKSSENENNETCVLVKKISPCPKED